MYEQFFGMAHTPFSRDVPPEALYESASMHDALGRLSYVYVADRQLFAVVTADAGCGKSTLIRKFAASLPSEKYILLYLSDSKLTPRWFYKGCLDQLGLESRFYRGDAKRQLQKEIEIIRGVQRRRAVLTSWGWNPAFTGATRSVSSKRRSRSSAVSSAGTLYAFWMKRISLRRRCWRNSGSS